MASEVGLSSRPSDGPHDTSDLLNASSTLAYGADQADQSQNKAVDDVLYSDVNLI